MEEPDHLQQVVMAVAVAVVPLLLVLVVVELLEETEEMVKLIVSLELLWFIQLVAAVVGTLVITHKVALAVSEVIQPAVHLQLQPTMVVVELVDLTRPE
tara:strand:+ start:124 stop:420 length:297 start_codon:yes stop_codon:yes gene_type:complete